MSSEETWVIFWNDDTRTPIKIEAENRLEARKKARKDGGVAGVVPDKHEQ